MNGKMAIIIFLSLLFIIYFYLLFVCKALAPIDTFKKIGKQIKLTNVAFPHIYGKFTGTEKGGKKRKEKKTTYRHL